LHGRIADSLRQTYGDDLTEIVVPLAVHCEQAGDFAGAAKYRRLAARVAARCCDYDQELDHLYRALQSLQRLPPSATRDERELGLQMALIPALLFRLPMHSPAVEAAAKRVTELSTHGETTPKLLQSLVALFNLEIIRCRLPSARSTAEPTNGLDRFITFFIIRPPRTPSSSIGRTISRRLSRSVSTHTRR